LLAAKVQNGKTAARPKAQRRLEINRRFLEPSFFAGDIGVDEIVITFRQVNDPFNQPDEAADPAGDNGDHNLNDALLGVAQVELVYAKAAQQNAEDSGHNFLF
jgi:hypothetical protein